MPKSDTQLTAKAQENCVSTKKVGVRTLKDLEDLRRLQSKLLRAFLAGEMNRDDYRTAVYGCGVLCQVMRELKPANGLADVVTNVIIGPFDEESEQFIAKMNGSIMDAPEGNSND